ncbi:epoxyqueuosine reductase QueH [Geobacter pelophilus]|uniref:Epoxyqueuosine reductase QueH n=1 Tax=Geoanaerobacter pelophilus TaxID=60036 RepID=A0AAW4L505_9BACT|nr:epoxyqueuosine reductase QueH [Geoanaerobacter pelophilus]MBT0665968.1 epoxyqueuosine reductase QueH [Geoanaerobacter pelophilus]
MRILLHICCAPCSIVPLQSLKAEGHDVTGFFFNHNIHPYQEYKRRLDAVKEYAAMVDLEMTIMDNYLVEEFLAAVAGDPANRCSYCYASRLAVAARTAAEQGFDAFTSSLLYSRYQRHDEIRKTGEDLAMQHGIAFHYDDYRTGWQEGIRISKELGLYRQQYCGCIYSEKDRYWKP